MSTLITASGTGSTTSPELVLGYDTARESRNIVHDLISGDIAVTLIAPRPRSGTLELLYFDEAAAFAGLALHEQETTFTLDDDDSAGVSMTYVVSGSGIRLTLDDETRDAWVLSVGYQEVDL